MNSDDILFYLIALTFFLLPTGTAPPLITLAFVVLVWIISGKVLSVTSILKKSCYYPVILFVLLPWVGLIFSKDMHLGMDYALKTKYWLVSIIISGLPLNKKRVGRIIQLFWAGLFIGACLAFIQYIGIMNPIREGYLGYGAVYSHESMYLIIGVLMASFYYKGAIIWRHKLIFFVLIVSFIFHLAVLEGRNGYFVFVLMTPLIVDNMINKLSKSMKIVLTLLLIGSLSLSPAVRQKFGRTLNELQREEVVLKGNHDPDFDRPHMFYSAARLFLKHPIIGIGTGSLPFYTSKFGPPANHPHNSVLYMAASFGIFGITAYIWLFGKMFLSALSSKKEALGYFVLSICMVMFLGGFLNTHILDNGTLLLLTMGYGFLNQLEIEKIIIKQI